MSKLELAPAVFDDFERFSQHLSQFESADVAQRLGEIIQALQLLTHSPLVGRKVKGHKRELVIGQGARGYVALYRYVAELDMVFVLAMRHLREAGYRR
jgi:toxin ParE1/3/4